MEGTHSRMLSHCSCAVTGACVCNVLFRVLAWCVVSGAFMSSFVDVPVHKYLWLHVRPLALTVTSWFDTPSVGVALAITVPNWIDGYEWG
jgi:hypothetical protein